MALSKQEINKRYRQRHPDRIAESRRLWRSKNPEKLKATNLRYIIKNREKIRKSYRSWYSKHSKIGIACSRRWQLRNPVKKRSYGKKWRVSHPLYERNLYHTNINYRLSKILRSRLFKILRGKNLKSVSSVIDDLGCTLTQLKQHLESLFLPGMNWANYGLYGWHIDHIRPLYSFDLSSAEEKKIACHYSNLQPLWAVDNLKKSKRTLVQ